MSSTLTRGDAGVFLLTDGESDAVSEIAAELAAISPGLVDSPDWMAAARIASCRLPARLLEALRGFRHDAGDRGLLLIRNLPIDDSALPPTPTEPQSVERQATQPASVIVQVMLQLGEIIAYRNEKHGALVQNVVPVAGQEKAQSNAGSIMLEMHTENAFHPHRPDFVGLLCLRGDHDRIGRLCISSVREALRHLDEPTADLLRQPRYRTEAPPSFGDLGDGGTPHPILIGDPTDPDLLVDFHATHPLDSDAERAMDALRVVLEEITHALLLLPGDLAIVDNRLAVHGRTSFIPRYDGHDRWLHRAFVHLNHRRSRAGRPSGGYVLG